jgi:hypothetical protein
MAGEAPVLGQVTYSTESNEITANWTASWAGTYRLALFKDFGTDPIQYSDWPGRFGVLSNPVLDTASVFTVAVATLDGTTVGPYSNPVAVIVGPPQNVRLDYDGEALVLSWTVPAGATVATGAEIVLRIGTDIVDNIEVDGTRTVWLRDSPLDPAASYSISVSGTVSASTGPEAAVPVVQSTPRFAQLLYSVYQGEATIDANNGTPDNNYVLEAELYEDEMLLQTAQGSSAVVSMSLSPLGPWALYKMRLAYVKDGSRGPWTNTLPLLVQPASITSIAYDGTSVTAQWDWVAGEPAPAGAQISILKSDGSTAASADAIGRSVTFSPDPALTANTSYTLTVLATRGNSIGTVSAAVPVLAFNIAPATTSYDGANLTVTWSDSARAGVTRTMLHLLMGGQIVQSQFVAGGTATMPARLATNAQYTVALQTLGDDTSGPLGTTASVISCIPEMTATQYTANGTSSVVHVEWSVAGQPAANVASWSVQLWEDGVAWRSAVTVAVGTNAADVSPGTALDASKTYTATVRGINGATQTGALSAHAPILAQAVSMLSGSYDGTNVVVAWTAAGDGASYVARLTDNGGTQAGNSVITGSTSAMLPLANASSPTYHALVRPLNESTKGSEVSLDLLTGSTAVTATSYDGAILNATWSALPGATSYILQLLEGSKTILEQAASGTSANLAAILAPAGTYTVSVRGVGANVLGPAGTAKAILAGPAVIKAITASSSAITVTWDAAPGGNNVTGYTATLEAPGMNPVTATGTSSATLAPASWQPWLPYTVRVQPTGTGLTGPTTDPQRAIASVPEVAALAYDGTNVVARWEPLRDEAATAYVAQIVDGDGNAVGNSVTTRGTEATLGLTPEAGKVYRVVLQAIGSLAKGPWSTAADAPVIIAKPAVSKVAYDGAFVTVTLNAVTDTSVDGYIARLYQDGVVVASESILDHTSTVIRLRGTLSATASYDASIAAFGSISVGEESAKATVISAVPRVTGSTVTSSQVTVSWNAASISSAHGISGYSVQLWLNGATSGNAVAVSGAGTGTANLPLGAALDPLGDYAVTVQATGTNSTGAAGEPVGLIASVPTILSAEISGFAWSLSWTAAKEGVVTGYRVTVTDAQGGNAVTFNATGTALAVQNTFANNQYLAKVQAVGGNSTGQASASANLYGSGASYYFSAAGDTAPAYLFRASSQPAGASAITLYLPDLFNNTPSISNPVFVLTKPATSASYPYLITIAQNSVAWQFTDDARTQLWNAYLQFLTDLDVLVSGTPQLKPGAFNLITQALGRALPLLFSEQLDYVYRFNGANGYIDLVPGMRLRVDGETRQFSGPPSTSNININGFVSSGTTFFDLGEYWQGSQLNTGFSSYLSLTGRPIVPSTNTTGGAAGGLDFYSALSRMPLFRLLYPANFPAANTNGYADLTDNIVIIGANIFGDLQGATNQYIANGNFSGYESKISQTWFRGRAVITPEIPILVNGTLEHVPVGTTVRQLLGMFGGGAYPAGSYAGGLTFRRAVNNIVDSIGTAASPEAVRTNDVRIADLALGAYSGGVDAFDLPVIQGDSLTFGGAA